jgi:FkbM family methyltransferase
MPAHRDDQPPRSFAEVPPRPQEQLLIDRLPEREGRQILCTSQGVAQFAHAAAQRFPQTAVHCHYLDLYHAQQTEQLLGDRPPNLAIGCAADFPAQEVDVVALPFAAAGEAELARDQMQAGHLLLRGGGLMLTSTDNPSDTWLHQEMKKLFTRVTRHQTNHGTVYLARKTQPLKKVKNFACEFLFRDRGRLIRAYSRPGVFAHRRLDVGARHLMNAMEVRPGERVLDIGCGSGALALAAALCAEGVRVHAVDANARAVECTRHGARLNGLANITAELNASGDYQGKGSFQLALANPPYHAHFRIAALFLEAGRAALQPGGRILAVTKLPDWYAEHMPDWYEDVLILEIKGYYVISGRKPG